MTKDATQGLLSVLRGLCGLREQLCALETQLGDLYAQTDEGSRVEVATALLDAAHAGNAAPAVEIRDRDGRPHLAEVRAAPTGPDPRADRAAGLLVDARNGL